jgi:hypothetical protein
VIKCEEVAQHETGGIWQPMDNHDGPHVSFSRGLMIIPGYKATNKSASHRNQPQCTNTHLFDHSRQGSPLERYPRVPLRAQRLLHGAIELCLACVWIGQVLHKILRSFLIPFLRNDDVCLAIVCSGPWIDTCNLLDSLRFRWCFPCPCSTP